MVLIGNFNEMCILVANGMVMFFSIEAEDFFCVRVDLESDLTLTTSPFSVNLALPLILDCIVFLSSRSHSCTNPNLLGEPGF